MSTVVRRHQKDTKTFDTRELLRRAHVVANWPPIYTGKESDKHREEANATRSQVDDVAKARLTSDRLRRQC